MCRNSADGAGVVGHDLSHIAVAPGGRLHQLAALIGQLDGQAVQFKHEHHLMLTHKAAQFLRILHFVQGQQRDRMIRFFQLADRRVAHGAGGRVRHLDARLFFQGLQFLKQPVIDSIADAGAVEVVILIAVAVEPVGQFPLPFHQILDHQAASSSKTRNAIISVSAVCSP